MRRVFMGQLRKVGTTEHLEWLLASLFPTMNPFHIEAHTTKDGRNKGCAWVYVTNASDEAHVLSLNRRIYLGQMEHGADGVWFVASDRTQQLEAMAAARDESERGGGRLPRQPVVSELPTGGRNDRKKETTNVDSIPKPRSAEAHHAAGDSLEKPITPRPSIVVSPPGTRLVAKGWYIHDPYSTAVLAQ